MAIRIEPKLEDTEALLAQILAVVLPTQDRITFLCPAGDADKVLARIRVMISRRRQSLRRRGKRPKVFTLRSSTHRETHEGLRYDSIVLWREVRDFDTMSEEFDDMLSKESAA